MTPFEFFIVILVVLVLLSFIDDKSNPRGRSCIGERPDPTTKPPKFRRLEEGLMNKGGINEPPTTPRPSPPEPQTK